MAPYPAELVRVAKKVVWYDRPEVTLADVRTLLTHVMAYGSPADVAVVERFVSAEEFRKVLESAPAGVFTKERWQRWHERFGMPVPPFPDADSRTDRLARRQADFSGARTGTSSSVLTRIISVMPKTQRV